MNLYKIEYDYNESWFHKEVEEGRRDKNLMDVVFSKLETHILAPSFVEGVNRAESNITSIPFLSIRNVELVSSDIRILTGDNNATKS